MPLSQKHLGALGHRSFHLRHGEQSLLDIWVVSYSFMRVLGETSLASQDMRIVGIPCSLSECSCTNHMFHHFKVAELCCFFGIRLALTPWALHRQVLEQKEKKQKKEKKERKHHSSVAGPAAVREAMIGQCMGVL